jgi:nucleoside phosphorylase
VSTAPFNRILLVAATARELAESSGWATVCCGVGPVDAAAATAVAVAQLRPRVVVHVGIAGAREASSLRPPALVIGTESLYCDLGVPERFAPHRIVTNVTLVEAARRALPFATCGVIGTSGRVGGTTGCDVEVMEGFGVLRAAALAGVPAIEVRSIANIIEEPDRAKWRFEEAFAAIVAATPILVREIAACVS